MPENSDIGGKPPGRPFEKGQSGNPGGRPRVPEEVKDMLRAATPKAAKVLVDALDATEGDVIDTDTGERHAGPPDWKLRLQAANAILDRTAGKATQPIRGEDADGKPAHVGLIFLPAPEPEEP
jgi:hypothetical protein